MLVDAACDDFARKEKLFLAAQADVRGGFEIGEHAVAVVR
jgi:hypothetical protein